LDPFKEYFEKNIAASNKKWRERERVQADRSLLPVASRGPLVPPPRTTHLSPNKNASVPRWATSTTTVRGPGLAPLGAVRHMFGPSEGDEATHDDMTLFASRPLVRPPSQNDLAQLSNDAHRDRLASLRAGGFGILETFLPSFDWKLVGEACRRLFDDVAAKGDTDADTASSSWSHVAIPSPNASLAAKSLLTVPVTVDLLRQLPTVLHASLLSLLQPLAPANSTLLLSSLRLVRLTSSAHIYPHTPCIDTPCSQHPHEPVFVFVVYLSRPIGGGGELSVWEGENVGNGIRKKWPLVCLPKVGGEQMRRAEREREAAGDWVVAQRLVSPAPGKVIVTNGPVWSMCPVPQGPAYMLVGAAVREKK